MNRLRVLVPTWPKLVFVVEWTLAGILLTLQHRGDIREFALNLIWPFVILYFVGCLFVAMSDRYSTGLRFTQLWLIAALLVLIDHALKLVAVLSLSVGNKISLLGEAVQFANIHNPTTWLANTLKVAVGVEIIVITLVVFLICTLLVHRFYEVNYRRSFWSHMSFAFLFAAFASAIIDYLFRGHVVDYILLPGVYAFDLKDFYSQVGVATSAIEGFDNSHISKRWKGWRMEYRETKNLVERFARFTVSGCSVIGRR